MRLDQHDDDEARVQQWVSLLVKHWALLLVGAVVGGLAGLALTSRTSPVYEASATVVLVPVSDPTGMFKAAGVRNLLAGGTLAAAVREDLDAAAPAKAGSSDNRMPSISVEEVPATQLLKINAQLGDATSAALAANAAAKRAVAWMDRLWQQSLGERLSPLEKQLGLARLALQTAEDRFARESGARQVGRSREFDPLEAEVLVRRKVYVDTAAQLEMLRLDSTSTTPLRFVESAVPPTAPLPIGRKRTVTLGVLAGLLIAAVAVVGREWRKAAAAPRPPALA